MNNNLLAALVSLTLIACGSPVAPEAEDLSASTTDALKGVKLHPKARRAVAPTPTWQAQVSDTSTNPTFKTSFTIATTYDLFLAFDIPQTMAGQHVAAFEITSPDGAMYQRTEVPFATGASTYYRVWSSMPVAGTWIQQFAMSGTWTVRVFLDAEQVSRATKTFVLQ